MKNTHLTKVVRVPVPVIGTHWLPSTTHFEVFSPNNTRNWNDYVSPRESQRYEELKRLSPRESQGYEELKWLSPRESQRYGELSTLESEGYEELKWLDWILARTDPKGQTKRKHVFLCALSFEKITAKGRQSISTVEYHSSGLNDSRVPVILTLWTLFSPKRTWSWNGLSPRESQGYEDRTPKISASNRLILTYVPG